MQQKPPAGQDRQAGDPARAGAAQKCLKDLQAFSEQMNKDGYWLTGWGTRWGSEATPPAAPPSQADRRDTRPADRADQARPRAVERDPGTTRPWMESRWGVESPRYQISTLYRAANVLGHRGDQQACDAVLVELREVYRGHVADLKKAGVEPGEVTTWRKQQIVAAKPVTDMKSGSINFADLIGMEVRNGQDKSLGTVDDVIFDQRSDKISYVVISRGGFLGMGEKHIAVPWKALRATPGMNMLVLPVSEEVMERAPKVDPDRFGTPDPQEAKPIDEYWEKQIQG